MPKQVHRCPNCDRPWPGDGTLYGVCDDCQKEFNAPGRSTIVTVPIWINPPYPAIGIHVAGIVQGHDQFCRQCGALLACTRLPGDGPIPIPGRVPFTLYPVGAIVERGKGWQAINLTNAAPTCGKAPHESHVVSHDEDRHV